jgi:hypothetical protein
VKGCPDYMLVGKSLQKLEHCLGLKPGVVLKQLLNLAPNIDERIGIIVL